MFLSEREAFEIFEEVISLRNKSDSPFTKSMEKTFREHSRSVADNAALIASYVPSLDKQEAYACGLLHDAGRLNDEYVLTGSIISMLWKEQAIRGEFIQASYRSSAALLGIAFIQNIYGSAGMGPLMIIGSVPLYNMMAVVVLSVFRPGQQGLDKTVVKRTMTGIVTNPIILGIVAGLLWSALGLPLSGIPGKTIGNIASMATPLGLMAMGASFDIQKAVQKGRPAIVASVMKLVGFCVIFLPVAIAFGFREEELVAILVMLGSATTVSCYVMARNMGHEGVLTSSTVMLTTLFSAFTLTGWLFLLRSAGLI